MPAVVCVDSRHVVTRRALLIFFCVTVSCCPKVCHMRFTGTACFPGQKLSHCEKLGLLRKSSLIRTPLYSNFLMHDGKHEKNKAVGQPCSRGGYSVGSFISIRLVLQCLVFASRAKKSAHLVLYGVLTICFLFFFKIINARKGGIWCHSE